MSKWIALFWIAATAGAQTPQIGYFFDTAGTQIVRDVDPFSLFEFYLLVSDVDGIIGWEASGTISDPSWTIFSVTCYPQIILECPFETWNYVLGLGMCLQPATRFQPLLRYQAGYFLGGAVPENVTVCVGPSSPSDFGDAPGYVDCQDQLVPLTPFQHRSDRFDDGCAVINCTGQCPVAVASSSFGSVKARFGAH